jgi:hypothetical protein
MTGAVMETFILPGLSLLPTLFNTQEARAMLIAIGMQESRFEHRFQLGGPARGFWQFERAGVEGVLTHHASEGLTKAVCKTLVINPTVDECYEAIAYNDALAVCFARLLLWTLPEELPTMGEHLRGWQQYIAGWRPGKPHEESWASYFHTAWLLC